MIQLETKIENLALNIYDPKKDEIITKLTNEYEGKRLVLLFYPADFTFVCPTELKDLGKSYKEFKDQNAEVLVVSTDTVFSHKRRIETEMLLKEFEIPMVSDRTTELSKYFSIFNEKSGNAERGTFIISPDGVLKSIEIVTEPIGRSAHELLRKVQALEFLRSNPGHACPASRNIGLKTLKPSLNIAGHVGEELE
ncbi:TPA: peroxiredoxin [Patescibacteria group bacterium]|nr:peroxiredoxin [Candidatus Gracilibacteria bacterium]